MSKTTRSWIELVWANNGVLRAQDIPYDDTLSIKGAIDAVSPLWTRTGTTLSPLNAGDNIEVDDGSDVTPSGRFIGDTYQVDLGGSDYGRGDACGVFTDATNKLLICNGGYAIIGTGDFSFFGNTSVDETLSVGDGASFNLNQDDNDFLIYKLTSGIALTYDAGDDIFYANSPIEITNGAVNVALGAGNYSDVGHFAFNTSYVKIMDVGETYALEAVIGSNMVKLCGTDALEVTGTTYLSSNLTLANLTGLDDAILKVSTAGLVEASTSTIGTGISGGSLLNLVPYTTDPVAPIAGDAWILETGGTKYFKHSDGTDVWSVEMTKE